MVVFSLLIALHMLAVVPWVGGMAFALLVLRPALMDMDPLPRLHLWRRVLGRFFKLVWALVAVILLSGYGALMLGYHGLGGGGLHIMVMQATGWIMVCLFAFASLVTFRSFRRALDKNDLAHAALSLDRIRRIVTINLILGLFTAAIGAAGTLLAY